MDRSLSLLVKLVGQDRLSRPLLGISKAGKELNQRLALTRRELGAMQKASAKLGQMRDLQHGLDKDKAALDRVRRGLAETRAAMKADGADTEKLTADQAKLEKSEKALTKRQEARAVQMKSLATLMGHAGVDTRDLGNAERLLTERIFQANHALSEHRRRLREVSDARARMSRIRDVGSKVRDGGFAMGASGVAVGLPIVSMVHDAMDLETEMSEIHKVLRSAPDSFIERLRLQMIDLSRRIPMTAADIAKLAAAEARAGIPANQLAASAEDAAKIGIAFNISAEQAGQMNATWRTAFGMSREQVRGLADQVIRLQQRFGGAAPAIAEVVTRVGPLAKVAGAATDATAALAQMEIKVGNAADVSATGIKSMLLALTLGGASRKRAKSAFHMLGLDPVATAKEMQQNAPGTILKVFTRIAALRKDLQAATITNLFGRTSLSAIAPLLTRLDQLKLNFDQVRNAADNAGTVEREFARRNATTANQLQLARNNLQALKIEVGTQLLPTIIKLAQHFDRITVRISAWTEQHKQLTRVLVLGTTAIAGTLIILGTLGVLVGGAITLFTMLAPAIAAISSGIVVLGVGLLNIGTIMLANPFGLLIAGVVLAAVVIWANWARIRGAFTTAWHWLQGLVPVFKTIGGQIWDGLVSFLSPTRMLQHFRDLGAAAVTGFKTILGIKSPSRVFMALGGHVASGLAIGVRRGGHAPVEHMRAIAGRMASAVAIGAAAPVLASAGTGGRAPVAAAASERPISIHIHGAGLSADEIAAAVRREIENMHRDNARRDRSSYNDED